MKLQVLSFTGKAFDSEAVNSVTVTTRNGEITVLKDHMPLVSALKPSVLYIKYNDENNVEKREDYAI
jgi:F0F1-type ATP synthase epsilon subunit